MFFTIATIAPAAIIVVLAVVLIIAAIVVFLLATIVELKTISDGLDVVIPPVGELVAKTQPVNELVHQIVGDLGAGHNLLEGLLVKKAGLNDSAGLIESMFPGGGFAFLQRQGRPGKPRHIGVVYSRGALQLARLGRSAPLGRPMRGSALRDPLYSSESSRALYPDPRGVGPTGNSAGAPDRPRTPVIGANSPNQYRRPGDDSVIYDSITDAPSSYKTGGPSRFPYADKGLVPDPSAAAPAAPISAATAAPNRFFGKRATEPVSPTPQPTTADTEPPEPATPAPTTPDTERVIRYRRG